MMKKVWLVLLAVVLVFGLGVFGCSSDSDSGGGGGGTGGGGGEGGGEGTPPVFQLSTILAGLEKTGPIAKTDFDGTPLTYAGNPDMEIVADTYALKITVSANWGEGLDIVHGVASDEFEFKAGDVIKITGKALNTFPAAPSSGDTWASPQIQLKLDQASNGETMKKASPQADDTFEFEVTLTAADITAIATTDNGDNPPNVRIGARPTGASFQIDDIIVTRE